MEDSKEYLAVLLFAVATIPALVISVREFRAGVLDPHPARHATTIGVVMGGLFYLALTVGAILFEDNWYWYHLLSPLCLALPVAGVSILVSYLHMQRTRKLRTRFLSKSEERRSSGQGYEE